jgi:hypothetical protein
MNDLRRELTPNRERPDAARHRGPSLIIVAIVYVVAVVASIVVPTVMAGGHHFPSPLDPEASRWFSDHSAAALASSFFCFASAVPLGIFTAGASSRLQFLGMKVAGIHIGLFGGIAASVALATSAFAQWTLAQPGISDPAAHMLHLFSFASGGPGFVVPFGLLVAGISVVAGLQAFISRWLMWLGLVIAAIAELSVFALVLPAAVVLLPIARFSGLLWMLIAAAMLPKSRRRLADRLPPVNGGEA